MNTILRWAGSKRQLLPKLQQYWPAGRTRYIEPFCGSACLFFAVEPEAAVLGDLNGELIQAYRTLRRNTESVLTEFKRLPRGRRNYYSIRAQDPNALSRVQRAARFFYLNRYCFNGIYRTNSKGAFNVPYGPQKKDGALKSDAIKQAAQALTSATLISGDFSETLRHARAGDFVYLDPPYAVRKRRVFREYHPSSFSVHDLARLTWWLRQLDRRGAQFVVSYADCIDARNAFAPWDSRRVKARRHVAGFAGNRRCAYELVVTNIKMEV